MGRPVKYALAAVLAVSVAACTPSAGPPTPHEAIPLPGSFYLTSEPAHAARSLSLRYAGAGGEPSGISDEFAPGMLVVVNRSLLPNPHGVLVNRVLCDGRFEIATGVETDIVLHVADDGCRVETVGSHPEGAVAHGKERASLAFRAPLGSRISVRSLDAAAIPPRIVAADESGSASIDFLPPGRYRVTLIVGEQVRELLEIELRPGEERALDLVDAGGPDASSPSS